MKYPSGRSLAAVLAVASLFLGLTLQMAAQQAPEPLSIARQGYVFAGGKYTTVGGVPGMTGQLYAEFQVPAKQSHPYPIVMVHGLFQSGTNFTGTPDGREGWAQFFLRQGYTVYVVDQPGRGRAAYAAGSYGEARQPNLEIVQSRFLGRTLWPQARLHSQWPGAREPGDAVFDQFYASQLPSIDNQALQQELNRDALAALLDKIGPGIVLTHSQSGAFGWLVADARPNLVKGIVAVEPNGPPVYDVQNVSAPEWFRDAPMPARPWGIAAIPLSYSPAAKAATDLAIVRQEKPDAAELSRCWMQQSPARVLSNLQRVPVVIVTGEASYHAPYDHCTAKFLEQAGVHATAIKLGDAGVHGNGHMMMLEKNNLDIAAVIARWLGESVVARR
jgi:pimeloyl-ACP methyl ester carboxylesterase